jgi:hypothetical protein
MACSAFGCAARDLEERDLGNTSPPLISNEPAQPGERLPVVGPDGWVDSFVEGHWVGLAENLFAPSGPNGERPAYAFPSGSVAFTLDISLEDPTDPSGQIIFGAGAIPEPEPGLIYPPGLTIPIIPIGSLALPLPPQEGRPYALREYVMRVGGDSSVGAGALALSYVSNAAYADWCALQAPRPRGDGRFDCRIESDPDDPTALCSEGDAKFDCDLFNLCQSSNICQCNEAQCELAGGERGDLWLIRDGDDLLGTLVGAVFDHGFAGRYLPIGSVRFQRVNP